MYRRGSSRYRVEVAHLSLLLLCFSNAAFEIKLQRREMESIFTIRDGRSTKQVLDG